MEKVVISLSSILLLVAYALPLNGATSTHGPIVGGVTSTSARFAVRTDSAASVKIICSEDSNTWSYPIYTNTATSDSSRDYFVVLDVTGITPNTVYFYQPIVNDQSVSSFVGKFKTFPQDGEAATFSFLSGSGQQELFGDANSGIGNIFPIMAQEDALFFLHQGDWFYPDTTDSEQGDPLNYFAKHMNLIYGSYKTRYDPFFPMAEMLKMMAVDYVYDDHDWVSNDCDGTYMSQGGANTIQVYQEAFPHYPLPSAPNGIWHKFTCGNADIFMVDNRAQRDPNMNALPWLGDRFIFSANYQDTHTILGDEQMSWLLNQLMSSTATWKFISSGTPFNPALRGLLELALMFQGTAFDPITDPSTGQSFSMAYFAGQFVDKWCGFPSDIYILLSRIIAHNIQNVIFLSGDTHTSGIDDGSNSLIPELMAGGLDRTNSQMVALAKKEFLIDIWNKGGHTYDNAVPPDLGNAYGRVQVFGPDSVILQVVSETQNILATHKILPGYVPRNVAGVIVPGGIDFGTVPQDVQGGSGIPAISTSIDTFKVISISVLVTKGNSQVVPVEQTASLASGEMKILQFGFNPVGNVGDTTQAIIAIQTNDPMKPMWYLGAQGVIGNPTGVNDKISCSRLLKYYLYQNFPNPFNPHTTIVFTLPKSVHVSLKIYDMLGREVVELIDGVKMAGNHEVSFNAARFASGLYFYKLQAGSFSAMKKMLLLK